MTELIPISELDDGFLRAKFLVESLMDTSKLAHSKHHYHVSIGLSILAYEEISKMQMFFLAKQKGEGISKEDWKLVTKGDGKNRKSAHVVKPEKSYLDRKKFIEERGFMEHLATEQILKKMDPSWQYQPFEEKTRKDPLALERSKSFGSIKNSCFYLDWENDNWQIFTKVAKKSRKALSEFFLWIVEFHYCTISLDYGNPTITNDETSSSFQKYVDNPFFKRQKEMVAILETPEFLKVRTLATKVIDNYRLKSNTLKRDNKQDIMYFNLLKRD